MSRKHRNKKRKLKRKYQDKRGMNRHHLCPASRQGGNNVQNLLRIYVYKHREWHAIFKLLTIEEVIALLKRVKRAKDNQGVYSENI